LEEAVSKKKVVVVGSGPGGLTAAGGILYTGAQLFSKLLLQGVDINNRVLYIYTSSVNNNNTQGQHDGLL